MSALEMQIRAIEANSELRDKLLVKVRSGIKTAASKGYSGMTIGCSAIWSIGYRPDIRSSMVDFEITKRFLWWTRKRAVIYGVTDVLESEGYTVALHQSDSSSVRIGGVWILEVSW